MSRKSSNDRHTKELRIGLVLYGGVSLAVYMNGIVTEIWNAVRASRGVPDDDSLAGGSTVSVYAKFLKELAANGCTEQLQIVVDTVAGTSAGGINGTFLAKAIVEGGDARILNEMWIKEASIERLNSAPPQRLVPFARFAIRCISQLCNRILLIRRKIERETGLTWDWIVDHVYSMFTLKDGSHTPLDGKFFTEVIAKALERMTAKRGRSLISGYQRFDLFLTRTDLHGWPRDLPVSRLYHPKALCERTHAHVMHFTDNGGVLADDFALTYATRTTAGFPFAFAPVAYKDVAKSFTESRPTDTIRSLDDFAHRHLREHKLAGTRFSPQHAWMVDGGILDNKPFSYVAGAIERKPAVCEVHRVVIYIEPDPESELEGSPEKPPPPSGVAKRFSSLLFHEPIYDDLRRLHDRNRKVDRIRKVVEAARTNLGIRLQGLEQELRTVSYWCDWATRFGTSESRLTIGNPGYWVLRAYSAARTFADAICRIADYPPHSRHAYFVQTLVSAWLDDKRWLAPPSYDERSGVYGLEDGQGDFIDILDISFYRRWLRTLAGAANREFNPSHGDSSDPSGLREGLDDFKRELASISETIDHIETNAGNAQDAPLQALADRLGKVDIDMAIAAMHDDAKRKRWVDDFYLVLNEGYQLIASSIRRQRTDLGERVTTAVENVVTKAACKGIGNEFARFPSLDQIAFPMMDFAGVEDLTEIEVMRISPSDSQIFKEGSNTPKGSALGRFAGFLRDDFRQNDLLLGRLHGAERLIDLIAGAASRNKSQYDSLSALRDQFKRRAVVAILSDESRRPNDAVESIREKLEATMQPTP